jgi:hypothetical protein
VTRNGQPIIDYHLTGGISAGINYNISYSVWDAAIAAGATLDELKSIDEGKYPSWFLGKVIAWHMVHRLIDNHQEDAVATSMKNKRR